MTIRHLTPEEIAQVGGGGLLRRVMQGCAAGGMAGQSVARENYKWQGAGAGCLAGASVAMAGGGTTRQAMAGMLAGSSFGPYAGSSGVPTAANYENGADRDSTHYSYLAH